jgi:hypothetical protein
MHGIPNVRFAHGVRPLIQLLQAGWIALAEPFKDFEFGQLGHG